jgi:hypothetical protein
MNEHPLDKAASLACGYAGLILDDLLNSKDTPGHAAAVVASAGWTVLVVVAASRPGEGVPGLNPCGKDILALLATAQEPLSGERICRQMEKQGIGVHAQITVKRTLARLRKARVVSNSRRSPRGYFLPERLPLMRLRPAA